MRESIGTAWIFGIVMTFIALFSSYLAFSINYSKSFRVKDGIIERIHKHNGFDSKSPSTLQDIDSFMASINYSAEGNCYKICTAEGMDNKHYAGVKGTTYTVGDLTKDKTYNYCIMKVSRSDSSSSRKADMTSSYYKVVVFYSLHIGNMNIGGNFRTSGETNMMYYPEDVIFK